MLEFREVQDGLITTTKAIPGEKGRVKVFVETRNADGELIDSFNDTILDFGRSRNISELGRLSIVSHARVKNKPKYKLEKESNMETKSATVTIESNKYYGFADAYADSASSAISELIKKAQDIQNAILVANAFKVKNVIFNPPATIVFWVDGTKTVVKAQNETFDPEKGLAMAFARKALGNKHSYYDTIKRYTKKHIVKNKEAANGNP